MTILKKILAFAIILGLFGQVGLNYASADLKSSRADFVLNVKGGHKLSQKIDKFFEKITDKQGKILRKKIDKLMIPTEVEYKLSKTKIILNYIDEKLNQKGYKSESITYSVILPVKEEKKETNLFENTLSDSDNKKVNDELIKIQNKVLNYGVDNLESLLGQFEKITNYEEKGDFRASVNVDHELVGKIKAELKLSDYSVKKSGFDSEFNTKVEALVDASVKGEKEIKLKLNALVEYIFKDQNYYLLLEKFNVVDKKGVEKMESFFEKAKELASNNKYIHVEDKKTKMFMEQIKQFTPKNILSQGKNIASKSLFKAFKKEGNKYFLIPSKYGCDTAKKLAQKFDPFNGDVCTDGQYDDLLEKIADSKIEIYIDFSGKNTEIGFDAKNKGLEINEGKIIFSDNFIEEIKYVIKPNQEKYLGDGGHIEYIRNNYLKAFLKVKKDNVNIIFDSELDKNNRFSKIDLSADINKFKASLKLENREISGKYGLDDNTGKLVGIISGKTNYRNKLSELKISNQFIVKDKYIDFDNITIIDYNNGKLNINNKFNSVGNKSEFDIGGKIYNGTLIEGNLKLLVEAKKGEFDYKTYKYSYTGEFQKIVDANIELKYKKITGKTIVYKEGKEILNIINTGKSEKDLFELNTKILPGKKIVKEFEKGFNRGYNNKVLNNGDNSKINLLIKNAEININYNSDTRGNKNNGNLYIDAKLDDKKVLEIELDNKSIKTYKKIDIYKPDNKDIIEINEAVKNSRLY